MKRSFFSRLRKPRAARRPLKLESLESRRVLAQLGLSIQLWTDASDGVGDPVKGAPITGPLVAGDTFLVQILADDVPESGGVDVSAGIISLPLDLQWDPAVMQFTGDDDATRLDNPLVTGEFPQLRGGTLDQTAGTFDDLQGGTIPALDGTTPIGIEGCVSSQDECREFSLLRFQALGAALEAGFRMQLAGSMSFADADPLTNDPVDVTVPIRIQAPLSGVKFDDFNGDGDQNPGEPPVPGVTIMAFVDFNSDGQLSQAEFDAGPADTDVTDSDGEYLLLLDTGPAIEEGESGSPLDYIIVEQLPADQMQTTPDTSVLDPGLDTGALQLGPFGYTVQVDVGQGPLTGFDFGNRTVTISLSGFVYADTNLNGVLDKDAGGAPQEVGLPNVLVTLSLHGEGGVYTPIDSMTTGPDGWYYFGDLEPGIYRVNEQQPAQFIDWGAMAGTIVPGGDTRGVVGPNQISEIRLAAGEHGVDYNFAENLRAQFVTKRFFVDSAPSPLDLLCPHVNQTCVTVQGTAGDDEIIVDTNPAGDTIRVAINGEAPLTFPVSETDVVAVDSGAGDDEIVLRGSPGDDLARMTPGFASLRTDTYGALATGAERTIVDGAGGDDLLVLHDTAGDEQLAADGNVANFGNVSLDLLGRGVNFERVQAVSTAGDDTIQQAAAVDYVLELIGLWHAI